MRRARIGAAGPRVVGGEPLRLRGDKSGVGGDAAKHNVEQKLKPMLAACLGEFRNQLIGGKRPADGGSGALVIGRKP